jgi:hypothetical protein
MGKTFHPECFSCAYCGKLFANTPFYLEDGLPYCEEGRRPLADGLPYSEEGRQHPEGWTLVC